MCLVCWMNVLVHPSAFGIKRRSNCSVWFMSMVYLVRERCSHFQGCLLALKFDFGQGCICDLQSYTLLLAVSRKFTCIQETRYLCLIFSFILCFTFLFWRITDPQLSFNCFLLYSNGSHHLYTVVTLRPRFCFVLSFDALIILQAKALVDPFEYEAYIEQQKREKMEAERASRITVEFIPSLIILVFYSQFTQVWVIK